MALEIKSVNCTGFMMGFPLAWLGMIGKRDCAQDVVTFIWTRMKRYEYIEPQHCSLSLVKFESESAIASDY